MLKKIANTDDAAIEKHRFPNPPIMPTNKKVAYYRQMQDIRHAHILLSKDNSILPNVLVHIAKVYHDLHAGKEKTALSQTKTVQNTRILAPRTAHGRLPTGDGPGSLTASFTSATAK